MIRSFYGFQGQIAMRNTTGVQEQISSGIISLKCANYLDFVLVSKEQGPTVKLTQLRFDESPVPT